MRRNITMAREMGLLTIPDSSLIDIEEVDRYEPGQVLVHLHRFPGRADVGARRCCRPTRTAG